MAKELSSYKCIGYNGLVQNSNPTSCWQLRWVLTDFRIISLACSAVNWQ